MAGVAGFTLVDATSLEVSDNLAVGCLDPRKLPSIARELRCSEAVQAVEDELGLPVMTAATATTFEILQVLGHELAISKAEWHH